jgi:prepilin-type N-terminal cleavage/methylation domain-containing protein
MNKIIKKSAFTLAEVLITLLIIGVISSIVIPTIINDTQNEEFYTLLKKDYGMLASVSKRMMLDNGGNLSGLFDDANDMQNEFGNYIIFSKKCTTATSGCFYTGTNTYKTLHGDDGWFDHTQYGATSILNSGEIILFKLDQTDCQHNYGAGSPAAHSCGWLHIDVNGFKGPNILGKDIFGFWVTLTGIYPFGIPNNYMGANNYCDKTSDIVDSGRGCAGKILSGQKVD